MIKSFEKEKPDLVSPFLFPVEQLMNIPGYSDVVRKPIDLIIIKAKIDDDVYDTPDQINADVQLMFKNSLAFNPKGDPYNVIAANARKEWNARWATLPPKEVPREPTEDVEDAVEEDDDDEFIAGEFW